MGTFWSSDKAGNKFDTRLEKIPLEPRGISLDPAC
jgi:hypothetical protein